MELSNHSSLFSSDNQKLKYTESTISTVVRNTLSEVKNNDIDKQINDHDIIICLVQTTTFLQFPCQSQLDHDTLRSLYDK